MKFTFLPVKRIFLLVTLPTLLTGCTTFKYRDIEIKSFLNKKAIKSATLTEKGADGVTRSIRIEGYSSDQTEAFGAAIEAMKAGAAMAK